MRDEVSVLNMFRVPEKLLSHSYLFTMNAIWIGVTLSFAKFTGLLGLDCFPIFAIGEMKTELRGNGDLKEVED